MLEDMWPNIFAKTRYYTPNECIEVGNKELEFVLLPNDIRRPNGREYRKLMEIVKMTKEQIDIINQSISNIKLLCSSMLWCNDCPMKSNCNEFPPRWELINNEWWEKYKGGAL